MSCFAACFDKTIDVVARKTLASRDDLTTETKALLRELDDSVAVVVSLAFPGNSIEQNKSPLTDADVNTFAVDLGWKKTGEGFHDWEADPDSVKKTREQVSGKFSIYILNKDDLTKSDPKVRIFFKALTFELFVPLEDQNIFLKDDEAAKRFMDDLGYSPGKALPVTYNTNFNMQSDESFSRIFFYSLGVVLLVRQKGTSRSQYGPLEVDMPLQHLAVRKSYRKYGARVHFNMEQQVTAIYDYDKDRYFLPGKRGWEEAKMLAKVTALTLVTAREHLSWSHLLCSQVMTNAMIVRLPPSHPIRRLLTVFSFNATTMNQLAFNSLVPENSILHRTTAFEYRSLKQVFDLSFQTCNIFEPFPDRQYNAAIQELVDDGKLPYVTQGVEYYEIVRKFVAGWLAKAGEAASDLPARAFYDDIKQSTKGQEYELPPFSIKAMMDLLSSIIFTVTAYHELVGNVVDYTILPSKAGFRLTEEEPMEIDLQSFCLTQAVVSGTSVRMPALCAPFDKFFGAGGAPAWERKLWENYVRNCKAQSAKTARDETERAYQNMSVDDVEFKYFDPELFECSVSL